MNPFKPKLNKFIVLLRFLYGVPRVVTTIRIKSATQDSLKYDKNNSFKIDQQYPTWINKKGKIFYFFNIDNGDQLTFSEIKNLDPKTLDKFIGNKFISDISLGLNPDAFSLQMKNIFIGIAIGAGMVGFILMILVNLGII